MSVNTQLVTLIIDPKQKAYELQCVLTLGEYSQERNKTEYSCMGTNESSVGLGSITRAPLEITTLYNEDSSDGQALLKDAFRSNADIEVLIEFDNPKMPTGRGTILLGNFGISSHVMPFPKDGKIGADFTLEFVTEPLLIQAGAAFSAGYYDLRYSEDAAGLCSR